MNNKVKVLAISGSIRKRSYNKALLMSIKDHRQDIDMEIFDLENIPMYNEDIEANMPISVKIFKQKIKEADLVLIATPEYNYSISGVLKNALDWASRPKNDNSFNLKPVGIMGVSPGSLGTSRAQYHLRQIGVGLNMRILNRPEIMIAGAKDKFNDEDRLVDEKSIKLIDDLINEMIKMID